MMAVPSLLRELGIAPPALLAEFGLEPAYFEEPENLIAFATMGAILSRCAEATRCPHFGLLAGQRAGISTLGTVGFVAQSSATVHSALDVLTQHYHAHNPGATLALVEHGTSVTFSYTIVEPDVPSEQILDGAMAIAFNLMRALCGRGWLPDAVRFAHSAPVDPEPFRRFFQSRPQFDAEETALVFPERWLDRSIPGADPLLHKMLHRQLDEFELVSPQGLSGQLRRMLPQFLMMREASVASVAGRLGIGGRTLNRRLAAEGVSFEQLRDEARHAAARRLLENTQLPVNEIADVLGYANTSGFTRAFRRWSGIGPSRWRAAKGTPI